MDAKRILNDFGIPLVLRKLLKGKVTIVGNRSAVEVPPDSTGLKRLFISILSHVLREKFTKLDIRLVIGDDKQKVFEAGEIAMKVNGVFVNARDFASLGTFVVEKMGVTVEEIRVRDEWGLLRDNEHDFKGKVHSALRDNWIKGNKSSVKVLTGMFELCSSGCDWCTEMAHTVKEWGAPQPGAFQLQNFTFDTMRITEKKLFDHWAELVVPTDGYATHIERMEEEINGRISCKKLIIELFKSKKKASRHRCPEFYTRSNPIPFEMVDRMLKAWKVEHLVFDFVALECPDERIADNGLNHLQRFFTPFCMEESNTVRTVSTHQLQTLEVTGVGAVETDVSLDDLFTRCNVISENLKTFRARKAEVSLDFNVCAAKETLHGVNKFEQKIEEMERMERGRIQWNVQVELCEDPLHSEVLENLTY